MPLPIQWGCDWTWRQGVVPAKQIEKEGFSYVWLKASGAKVQGGYYEDPCFQQSAKELRTTSLIKGAYHYLMPGNPGGQAAHFIDQVHKANVGTPEEGSTRGWLCKLDIEQDFITVEDIIRFIDVWRELESRPLWVYSSKSFWNNNRYGQLPYQGLDLYLEEAHWIDKSFRNDAALPYASQQYKKIDMTWWDTHYGSWPKATMLQFTDYAKIAGYRQVASAYQGRREILSELANA